MRRDSMLTGTAAYLQEMYEDGKITETKLDNAVSKDWITSEEKQEIIEE